MNEQGVTPPLSLARDDSPAATTAAAARFWFEDKNFLAPDAVEAREKYVGVGLVGILLSLATFAFYAASGQLAQALPYVSIILFFTTLGIGFLLLRVAGPEGEMDPKVISAVLEESSGPAILTDGEGRLVSANDRFRDHFSGRTPSIKKLLDDKKFGPALRDVLKEAIEGKPATYRLPGPKGKKGESITATPQGAYILWVFSEGRDKSQSLSALGDIEGYFKALLDRFSLGLVIRDERGIVRYANPHATRLLSLQPNDLKGKKATEILTPEYLKLEKLTIDWMDLPGPDKQNRYYFGLVQGASEAAPSAVHIGANGDFSTTAENAPIAIAVIDTVDFKIEHLNIAAASLIKKYTGKEPKAGQKIFSYLPESYHENFATKAKEVKKGGAMASPLELILGQAGEAVVQAFFGAHGATGSARAVLYLIDTSEAKKLEVQLVQAQKMEAVGQLAGGVAHDFNNLLTAILGFCDLLLMRHKAGDQSFADLIQIKQNANRAADLIRQLLAFSRQQALHPRVLNLTDVVSDLSNLIRRLIGEKIKLKITHGKNLGSIRADQGQIEQVIINLAVNARDAMPDGGNLSITTSAVAAKDVARLGFPELQEKDYVQVSVTDTGIGIPKDNVDKIFEPFFTTKGVGEGTGLGLSTVYGIVTQTGGNILLESEVAKGSTFHVFLPALAEEEVKKVKKDAPEKDKAPQDLTGTEVILFCEDEDPVRKFVARALQNKGYKVLEADSGEAAMEVVKNYQGPLDLLISDVVMPNMDGPTVAREVIKQYPDIKVIFISGYAEAGFDKGLEKDRFEFVSKPFSLQALAEKVRTVLEEDKK